MVPAPVAGEILHVESMFASNCVVPDACSVWGDGVTNSAFGSKTTAAVLKTAPPAV
jgi:hypothetical protein